MPSNFAKKRFGQNFIKDTNLIRKIVNLLNANCNCVIEVGPGQGALTKYLVDKFKKVIAIEIDEDLKIALDEIKNKNLKIIWRDFREANLSKYLTKNDKVCFISNTPYYLTSEMIFYLFELSKEYAISNAVLMVQKEVGQRICANVGDKKYNNLSIACALFSTTKYEFAVPKQMFLPIPKVDSCIISFDFSNNKYDITEKNNIIKMVRKLFNGKRKTILNNLKNTYPEIKNYHNILSSSGIDPQSRPGELTIEDYINLYNNIKIN